MSHRRALSPLESAFLLLESRRAPLHMGSVGIFEGDPLRDAHGRLRLGDIRSRIERRLDLVPKLRCRVQASVLPGAPPVWADHPQFDIARHVQCIRLPAPGNEDQLWKACSDLFSRPLDRTRPRWHMCIVDGLADGRVAVVDRIHHALADGLAGVEMATLLFDREDPTSDPQTGGPVSDPWQADALPGAACRAVEDLGRLGDVGWRWTSVGMRAATHPAAALRGGTRLAGAVTTLIASGILRSPTSLNRPISSDRQVLVVRRSIRLLRAAARAYGVTMNDLVLTAVGAGLARLVGRRGQDPPKAIQVLVPVGLDRHDKRAHGNRVSSWFVKVPVGTTEPATRVRSVSRSSGRARARHEELAAEVALELLAPVPQPVLSCLDKLVDHQPFFNLVVTNVPGPSDPLYLMGAPMLEAYPFVPLAGNLPIGVAALSYHGQLSLGVLADPTACPDASDFVVGLEEDLDRLTAAAPPPSVGGNGSQRDGAASPLARPGSGRSPG